MLYTDIMKSSSYTSFQQSSGTFYSVGVYHTVNIFLNTMFNSFMRIKQAIKPSITAMLTCVEGRSDLSLSAAPRRREPYKRIYFVQYLQMKQKL